MKEEAVGKLIELALAEDLGDGDVTLEYFLAGEARAGARIVAREAAVLAGTEVAAAVFERVGATVSARMGRVDGERVAAGDAVMAISGPVRAIVSAERVALNFLQRLSGVATKTRQFVEAVDGLPVEILDTRKTTPGWRVLEKAAVRAGGGRNHRMGLYDQVMVKDNHLLAEAGTEALQDAIARVKADRPGMVVELEADTLDQVERFLNLEGVDMILLDNMTLEELRAAVVKTGGRVALEASGGVTLDTVREIALTGVDFLSVGALTHSAVAVDLSLELTDEP